MGSDGIGLGQVEVLAGDLDVLDAVFAVHAGEQAVLVGGAGGLDVGVDLIGQAGNLQEAAVLAGHVARAPLQRVEDLLAGGLDHAQGVAEGMHLEDSAQSDIARGDGDADARRR